MTTPGHRNLPDVYSRSLDTSFLSEQPIQVCHEPDASPGAALPPCLGSAQCPATFPATRELQGIKALVSWNLGFVDHQLENFQSQTMSLKNLPPVYQAATFESQKLANSNFMTFWERATLWSRGGWGGKTGGCQGWGGGEGQDIFRAVKLLSVQSRWAQCPNPQTKPHQA